ncbi:hypothetical protein HYH02_002688 [Chlamydomonas schloesseri]|nr:hypothetical protein HYH02_002688 [Chlamydomonas schloesseri]|eukprot:KAG2452446.1 hypothetical protein HYH02_002688 [Chlamydomonas schloesseri]
MRQRILAVLDAADGAAAVGGGCGGEQPAAAAAWRATVVEKLLAATDANDLDLMLQHPVLLLAQAEEYRRVLLLQGEGGLASHTPAPLAWEEMQRAAGGGLEGLPIGYQAAASAAGAASSAAAQFASAAAALSSMQRLPLLPVSKPEQSPATEDSIMPMLLTTANGEGVPAGVTSAHVAEPGNSALALPLLPPAAPKAAMLGRRALLSTMLRASEECGIGKELTAAVTPLSRAMVVRDAGADGAGEASFDPGPPAPLMLYELD